MPTLLSQDGNRGGEMVMVLPQIVKRLFPRRSGSDRPDREHTPGTEEAPPRSGDEALEEAVEARKRARPNTPDR